MSFRIYRDYNYFIVQDLISGEEHEGIADLVIIRRDTTTSTVFYFENVTGLLPSVGIDIDDIIDYNGNKYSLEAFITYYHINTGGRSII